MLCSSSASALIRCWFASEKVPLLTLLARSATRLVILLWLKLPSVIAACRVAIAANSSYVLGVIWEVTMA